MAAKKADPLEVLLNEVLSRFDEVNEKLDMMLSKTASLSRMVSEERDPSFKTQATVNKKFTIPEDKPPTERKMYKTVCAACKQPCEVPFIPSAGRPVYCKTCFMDRKKAGTATKILDREEMVEQIAKTLNIDITDNPGSEESKSKKAKPKKAKAKGRGVRPRK